MDGRMHRKRLDLKRSTSRSLRKPSSGWWYPVMSEYVFEVDADGDEHVTLAQPMLQLLPACYARPDL